METVIIILHIVVAFFLVGSILLQAGKGADIGAAFGAGSSQTVFGPRGATTLLHKITIVVASLFLLTSITLAYFSRQEAGTVLNQIPKEEEGLVVPPAKEETEALPAESPVKGD